MLPSRCGSIAEHLLMNRGPSWILGQGPYPFQTWSPGGIMQEATDRYLSFIDHSTPLTLSLKSRKNILKVCEKCRGNKNDGKYHIFPPQIDSFASVSTCYFYFVCCFLIYPQSAFFCIDSWGCYFSLFTILHSI